MGEDGKSRKEKKGRKREKGKEIERIEIEKTLRRIKGSRKVEKYKRSTSHL